MNNNDSNSGINIAKPEILSMQNQAIFKDFYYAEY